MGTDWGQARYDDVMIIVIWISTVHLCALLETAINIGYSCKLLTEDMKEVLIIDAEEEEGVLEQLKDANDKIDSAIQEFKESAGDEANTVRQLIVVFSLFNWDTPGREASGGSSICHSLEWP